MHRGYIRLWRKSLESPVQYDRDLWYVFTFCLRRACWKDCKTLIPGTRDEVELKRGSFITGQHSLYSQLFPNCDQDGNSIHYTNKPCSRTVYRWIEKLEAMGCVSLKVLSNRCTIVSVCNYSTYQPENDDDVKPDVKPVSKSCQTDVKPVSTDKEGKESIEGKEREKTTGRKRPSDRDYSTDFEAFWDNYPKVGKVKKPDAWKAWQKAIKRIEPSKIIDAVKLYAESDKGQGQYAGHASTWLNNDRWTDDPTSWQCNLFSDSKTTTATVAREEKFY